MGKLHRYFQPGQCVFLTLACHSHFPWLAADAEKSRLVRILRSLFAEHAVACHAWVLLADHLHLLVTDPQAAIPTWVQKLKLRFVRGHPQRPLRIWQRRYWDHVIRDEADWRRHLDYNHHNPVKHGLAERTGDYPWSSFSYFARHGWYPPDWQAFADDFPVEGTFGEQADAAT